MPGLDGLHCLHFTNGSRAGRDCEPKIEDWDTNVFNLTLRWVQEMLWLPRDAAHEPSAKHGSTLTERASVFPSEAAGMRRLKHNLRPSETNNTTSHPLPCNIRYCRLICWKIARGIEVLALLSVLPRSGKHWQAHNAFAKALAS